MNPWIKTRFTLTSSVMRMIYKSAFVIVAIIVLGSTTLAQSDSERLGTLLRHHFFAVTRAAILSYSVFGMMRRFTNSPGSL